MRIIIYVFFFTCFQMYSQKINVDSLITQLKSGKLSPEGKHKLYNQLFSENLYKDKTKAIRYNTIIYNNAKKNNLKSGMGDFYYNCAFIKFSKSDYKSAIAYSKKACKEFYEDKNFDDYLNSISRLCMFLKYNGRSYDGFQLAQNKIKLFKSFSNLSGLGDLYFFIAEYYFETKNYKNAIIYAKTALKSFQKTNNFHGIALCNLFIGDVYFYLENYSESIKYVKGIDELPDKLKNAPEYRIVFNFYMAKNLIKVNKYVEAVHFSDKAIRLIEKSDFDLILLIETKLVKADAYQKLGNNFVASNLIRNIEKEIPKYLSEPEVENSLKYINNIKSNIWTDYKQYELALESCRKNLKFKEVDFKTYEDISHLEYKLERYKEAFESQSIFLKKKIEQLILNQKENLNELQVLYSVKENEFKIQNLKIKELKSDLEIKKQKEFSRNTIIFSIVLLIFLIFGFYIYRIRIKISEILKYKNEKLQETNNLLNKSLREKELLLKEIHHRVKNNLQLVSSILNIQANESPNISVSEFLDKSQHRISSIALIHQNLYMSENLEKVDFQTYTDELVTCILDSFSESGAIKYEIVANNNSFNIQTSISLGLIISELSCNAIKHAFVDNKIGLIFIEINQLENRKFEMIFGDNGSRVNNSFKSSKSIGLELVGLLANQLNGEISKFEKNGTFYKLTFEEVFY